MSKNDSIQWVMLILNSYRLVSLNCHWIGMPLSKKQISTLLIILPVLWWCRRRYLMISNHLCHQVVTHSSCLQMQLKIGRFTRCATLPYAVVTGACVLQVIWIPQHFVHNIMFIKIPSLRFWVEKIKKWMTQWNLKTFVNESWGLRKRFDW